MNVLVPIVLATVALSVAYHRYGRFVSQKLGVDPERTTPAIELEDGRDYVPTRCGIVFAHHYASIAGAGPILGPTMALVFGVVPAFLWTVLGGIFIGAVHDFASLFVSMRERGRSIAETVRGVLGPVGFFVFILFLLVMLVMVTSAFLAASAKALTSAIPLSFFGLDTSQTLLPVTRDDPTVARVGGIASTSVILLTLFAPVLGYLLYRRNLDTRAAYVIAGATVIASVVIGLELPVRLEPKTWMVVLAVYSFIAAGLPVWVLLQPRDFANVLLLYGGMGLLFLASLGAGLRGVKFQAPMADMATGTANLGAIWPVLFITIACGAISGFHALVSGGTSCKQLKSEADAQRVGFGGMLLESMLAVMVLVAVGAGLSHAKYLTVVYPGAPGASGNPILAFALGVGALLESGLLIPKALGTVVGVLMVEGFVVTTLDTAIRLNRYVFEEFWTAIVGRKVPVLGAAWFNSGLSVALMLLMAWGNAFNALWPVFATANQLLAALTLIAVSAWLTRARKPYWYVVWPAFFMIATTTASLLLLLKKHFAAPNYTLAATDFVLLLLSAVLTGLAVKTFLRPRPADDTVVGVAA